MIKTLLAAIPLCIMNLSEGGLLLVSFYMFTGMICWKDEFIRNLIIGFYIVGGFWLIAGSSM